VKTAMKSAPLRTLMQAHEELVRIRPCRKAALPVWLAYYRHSAEVYEQIAKTDPTHDGEAMYWAQRERVSAKGIEGGFKVWGLSINRPGARGALLVREVDGEGGDGGVG